MTVAQEKALAELWPVWGIDYDDTRLDLAGVFERQAPCVLEIGFGDGENLVNNAVDQPGKDFIGIEVHRPGVGRLLMQIHEHGLSNVRVICHDAVEVLRHQLPADSLDEVNVLFPDPWPKKRHHKRRLIQAPFLELLAQSMKPGGRLHIATDWEAYAEHIHECLEESALFGNTVKDGSLDDALQSQSLLRSETKFERRGKKLGHSVWDFVYRLKDQMSR